MCSSDPQRRYAASSGGVLTEINRFLFREGLIRSSIAFEFTGLNLFQPRVIYSEDEIIASGSIYHEIELVRFIKDNLHLIKSPVFISVLPCQVDPVRLILNSSKIKHYVVALTCSGQLTKDATFYLLQHSGLDLADIKHLRYRGNGWPSGVQIELENGKKYYFDNLSSIWMDIFHSQIFTLKKCFFCKDTFGVGADLSFADPWLKQYLETDSIGHTLVFPFNKKGLGLIEIAEKSGFICTAEILSTKTALSTQRGTLNKKGIYAKYKIVRRIVKIFKSPLYEKVVFRSFPTVHRKFFQKIVSLLCKIEKRRRR